jgi:hypothetical protein
VEWSRDRCLRDGDGGAEEQNSAGFSLTKRLLTESDQTGWLRGWDEIPCIRVSLMVNNASHLSRKGRGAAITP